MNKTMALKLLVTGLVMGVILIVLSMVNGAITDRQQYRDDALKSIGASYAGAQTIVGPVLVRPYTQTTVTFEDGDEGAKKRVEHVEKLTATSFPRVLDVRGRLKPNQLRHGLYSVTVYEYVGHLSGGMEIVQPETKGTVEWGEPYLALSVGDVRGIVGTPAVMVNGAPEVMVQGGEAGLGWQPNLRIPLHGRKELSGKLEFAIDLTLNGTEMFSMAPVGDSNHVELSSAWPSPLFAGKFLPRNRTVSRDGFTASWDVSSLATGTQVQMVSAKPIDTMDVSLLTPIDPYKLSDRATKYGILFVVLTFGGFFLFEMLKELPIHPVQYLLVGFGLAIFFLLLVSFSEHIAFALAYMIASVACIGLLTFYLSYVLRAVARGVGFGAMLATLYAAVYGLLISEDNALILGSLLLFAVLAAVMVVTRKVDWYKAGGELLKAAAPAPSPMPVGEGAGKIVG
ncbi:inner membrane protein [Granulicella rosea]|uniref:Inner membrane protein n=1 Tax=Granulicella rosea TaxID=474952 RepID=A0A239E1E0_9BACT|nr:cell envelope integrity protein CreD [Granulicella rosea]SNS37812.1 inner membrane protein [Granulicella rosea]